MVRYLLAALAAIVTITSLVGSASAEPKPSLSELKARVERYYDEIEKLTEQYNGLKVRLEKAKKAETQAKKALHESQLGLDAKHRAVRSIAQTTYMRGSDTLPFFASGDPSAFLGQASLVDHMADQKTRELTQATEAISRARKAEQEAAKRQADTKRLMDQMSAKVDKIRSMVARTESAMFKRVKDAVTSSSTATKVSVPIAGNHKGAKMARAAMKWQGTPYSWGGGNAKGPTYGIAQGANIKGFDCSGLTLWAAAQIGVKLSHYTGSQWNEGRKIPASQARAGDLIFFNPGLHHVGIYLGGGLMLHAPQTGDVVRVAPIAGRSIAGYVRVY